MDPITAGLIAGGIGLIGSEMTNSANTDIANSANTAAQQRQDQANQFNAQQYATRYQTTVKDLQAAGLNPMLAYGQGAGSQPTAQAAPVNVPAPRVNSLSNAAQGAIAASMNAADLKLKAEQVNATNAQTEQMRTQGLANTAQALKTTAEIEKVGPEIDVLKKTLQTQAAQIESLKAGASASSAQAAKTGQETQLGIVSSNPITQGWGEIKRGAQWIHGKFAPQLELMTNSATKAMRNRAYNPQR
jgi:hypothetical protein